MKSQGTFCEHSLTFLRLLHGDGDLGHKFFRVVRQAVIDHGNLPRKARGDKLPGPELCEQARVLLRRLQMAAAEPDAYTRRRWQFRHVAFKHILLVKRKKHAVVLREIARLQTRLRKQPRGGICAGDADADNGQKVVQERQPGAPAGAEVAAEAELDTAVVAFTPAYCPMMNRSAIP